MIVSCPIFLPIRRSMWAYFTSTSKSVGCLAARYDHVVIDTPSVGAFVDAAVVAQVSDATLLVVREGFVERASVQKAAEQLRAAGANLVGTVMNCCDTATSAYYAAYGDKAE